MKIGPPTVTGEELQYWGSYRIERGIRDGELSLNQCWPDRTMRIVAAKLIDKAAADGKRILYSWSGGPWEPVDHYNPIYGLADYKIDPEQETQKQEDNPMNNEENENKPQFWHTERDFTWVLHMMSEEGLDELRVQAEIQGRGEPGTVVTIERNNSSVEIPIHMIEPLEDLLGNIRRTARMKPFPCLDH